MVDAEISALFGKCAAASKTPNCLHGMFEETKSDCMAPAKYVDAVLYFWKAGFIVLENMYVNDVRRLQSGMTSLTSISMPVVAGTKDKKVPLPKTLGGGTFIG